MAIDINTYFQLQDQFSQASQLTMKYVSGVQSLVRTRIGIPGPNAPTAAEVDQAGRDLQDILNQVLAIRTQL
jgi:hypothetical protein